MTGLLRPLCVAPVVLILALTIRSSAQGIPAPSTPQSPRTGMIVGQVVDASTGAPLSEAIVTLALVFRMENRSTPLGRVMADGEGRFFFTDLPAGAYSLQATRDGYIPGRYRERRPSVGSELLTLREGERRIDVTLRQWKYAVISGTVVDEAGEPVVGVAVRALTRRIVAGRPQYGTGSYLVPNVLTDDRGMFRLSSVVPGTYVIVAPSTQTTLPVSVMTGLDAYTLRVALAAAGVNEVSPLGQPRTQQMGDFALMTMNSVLIPPQPSATGRMNVYRTTFYPAATKAAEATPIAIQAGEERSGVTMTLRPVPAVRVSGRLVGPDGSPPPPMAIRLAGEAMSDVPTMLLPSGPADVGFDTVTGMSDAVGRFTLLGVPPGEYVLAHANRFLGSNTPGRSPFWTSRRITVGTDDVSDLTVEVRPALRVEGRIEFRGAAGLQATPSQFLRVVSFEGAAGDGSRFAAEYQPGAPATFATRAAGGRYVVQPVELVGWFVQSVTLDGKDITDRPFDLQTDVTSIVVTYTDRPSKISGRVKDPRGGPSGTAVVLAFPTDRAWWTGHGSSPRNLRNAFTTEGGGYTFDHLPAGDYHVIAVDDALADDWRDPKMLETLSTQATTLTVVPGAPKTLDLSLKTIR